MKNLEKYLTEVKRGIPDIEQRLNGGAVRKFGRHAGYHFLHRMDL